MIVQQACFALLNINHAVRYEQETALQLSSLLMAAVNVSADESVHILHSSIADASGIADVEKAEILFIFFCA